MNLINELNIDVNQLDKKKSQTTYKIKYIKEYITGWIQVSVCRDEIKYINFIDCMCNAGIYADGDLGTSIEVLRIFTEVAKNYQFKEFHIYLNDYNKKRVAIISSISKYFLADKNIKNIFIHTACKNANDYLQDFSIFDKTLLNKSSTVLFVDPYNFQSIRFLSIRTFTEHYYCELYYNLFTSDYIRNKKNSTVFYEILNTTENLETVDDMVEYVRKFFKTGKMQYSFSYGFRNSNNSEIYQILFVTPNIRGLEKLKEALIKVFHGVEYYRNQAKQEQNQLSLFDESEEKNFEDNIFTFFGKETQDLICKEFSGKTCKYSEIEIFILEKTTLSNNNIIKYVLKPLIENEKLIKNNKTKSKKNYKDDTYTFMGNTSCKQ